MKSQTICRSVVLVVALGAVPALAMAQVNDETIPTTAQANGGSTQAMSEVNGGAVPSADPNERVFQYDLSGPRIGATLLPDGDATSQFGWHSESQASPSKHGPWLIVERVFLVAGTERNRFVPTGTLIFGARLPNSFEFGLGPSVTLGGIRGLNTGIVAAVGHSFRAGGIRIPVNVACAAEKGGELRWTFVTGWAIRDRVANPPTESQASRRDRERSI